MPIEDADKIHSKKYAVAKTVNIFGVTIKLQTLIFIVGGGIGAVILLIAGILLFTATPPPIVEQPVIKFNINDTNIKFDIIKTNYNYNIIKMEYVGSKEISNVKTDLLLSMYSPDVNYYVQRQSIVINSDAKSFGNTSKILYVYTGIDNTFKMRNLHFQNIQIV